MKLPCPGCRPGPGKQGLADCERCEGSGKIEVAFRWTEVLTPAIVDFLTTFRFWRSWGRFPTDGGVMDQAATWVDACVALDSALTFQEAEDREKKARVRASQAKRK